jgi:hypothetical protein
MKYIEAQKEEQKGYNEDQLKWIAMQGMIAQAKVAHDKLNMPDQRSRLTVWKFVNSQNFQLFIMLFIVLNMFQMALDFEGAPFEVVMFLRYSNYVFTTVFMVECALKLFAYGTSYF